MQLCHALLLGLPYTAWKCSDTIASAMTNHGMQRFENILFVPAKLEAACVMQTQVSG